jgi:hypothetical protein
MNKGNDTERVGTLHKIIFSSRIKETIYVMLPSYPLNPLAFIFLN